ncbi:MAG: hypothetical protein CL920_25575 [Deltaproteobacteria bacterium]|nr:hypothetical protein [Deltaproteobacteria bacterium]MBU52078.1 hypothetical protein [Deltaproteobacteria bacterium]|tara:strand:- start:46 stop:894 length:849 start_codon:yes stop_codon:yes gene_type:complete
MVLYAAKMSGWAFVPFEMLWMFLIALVISAGGFYRLVYFVSIGYAFSITGMAIAGGIFFWPSLGVYSLVHMVALGIYGTRLGTFLVARERKPSYKKELKEVQERAENVGVSKKLLIWLGVSMLYVAMFSPGLFHLTYKRMTKDVSFSLLLVVGLVIAFGGILLEALADHQKSAFKKDQPDRFCDVGLYRHMRCPNYFGEILFWIGNWCAGIPFYTHLLHWVVSLIGLVCIILIMMGSTKRLEHKQDERYGELEAYQQYVSSVPVLFPFVPLYSLKEVKVYLE